MSSLHGNMEHRYTERDAYCRGCDKKIERHSEKVTAMYSWRNRGQHIYLCDECISKAFGMVATNQLENKDE